MAIFEIYDKDTNVLKVSSEFKLPQLNTSVGVHSLGITGSSFSYANVSAAFDPRNTSGSNMRVYNWNQSFNSNNNFSKLLMGKSRPALWFNMAADQPFAPVFYTLNPASSSYTTSLTLLHASTNNKTLRVAATSLNDYGSYSDRYLAVYNTNGELTWSVDKVLKSPRILGRLLVPANSKNSLTNYGFLALPPNIDLTRVYLLPNLCYSHYEFDDAPAATSIAGISYCITSSGVYGRMFGNIRSNDFTYKDVHILVAYI